MNNKLKGASNALYDGDHLSQPPTTLSNGPHTILEPKKVKEVHAMVRNHLCKEEEELSSSYHFWSGFVLLLEHNSEGAISCTHDPLKASDLSIPTRPFSSHLKVIF